MKWIQRTMSDSHELVLRLVLSHVMMSDTVLLAAKHEVARSPEPELTRGEVAVR